MHKKRSRFSFPNVKLLSNNMLKLQAIYSHIFILLLIFFISDASVPEPSITSNKVYVDETSTDAMSAKEKAIKNALIKTARSILKIDLSKVDASKLKYSFVILKEKFSSTRYQAILQFTFHIDNDRDSTITLNEKNEYTKPLENSPKQKISYHSVLYIPIESLTEWEAVYKSILDIISNTHYIIRQISNKLVVLNFTEDAAELSKLFEKTTLSGHIQKTTPSTFILKIPR